MLERDRDTRAREERTRSEAGEREADFQMDINSSASSTPRSSLITPLQLLSLIKAGCRWVLRQAAATTREREEEEREREAEGRKDRERNEESPDPFI